MTSLAVPLVAQKTITNIQEGSVYKERFTLSTPLPPMTTARMVFLDSAGAEITVISGEVNGRTILFQASYAEVEYVPNGAGFYVYIHLADDAPGDEHMVFYGTVFRRQLSFPDSPATSMHNLPRRYEDDFQRPSGPVGGRWKVLVGRPWIYEGPTLLGQKFPNTVGPDTAFFARYFMRFYVPFNSDTVTLSLSATDKGSGTTVVALCCNADASLYLYAAFHGRLGGDKVSLGIGRDPDIGKPAALDPQTSEVPLTVPGDPNLGTYKLRYDDTTKTLGLYSHDYSTEYVTWTDDANLFPHGKGFRYFGIGGIAHLFNTGVQVAYIQAQDDI